MTLTRSLVALLAAATASQARTPVGFEPASNAELIVEYNGVVAINGAVVPRNGMH